MSTIKMTHRPPNSISLAPLLQAARPPAGSLGPLRGRAFFVSCFSGGGISRAAISATPFLLPLMLEVGFGLSPLQSGLLLPI
ncbi:MAG TPA: hypothetical protein VFA39_05850 [Steroidobacteraceae bacterium]|nr:hypothetical protein [Steroidobacteraceae bacterium]